MDKFGIDYDNHSIIIFQYLSYDVTLFFLKLIDINSSETFIYFYLKLTIIILSINFNFLTSLREKKL